MDVSSQDFDHLISYVFEDNIIWGKFNYGGVGYNLKLDVKTGTCQLKRFSDLGYGFLCSHNGWYYQAFEPAQLMMLINSDKQAPWPIWTLLEEALEPYKDKINETDNYYILRMRKKNDN